MKKIFGLSLLFMSVLLSASDSHVISKKVILISTGLAGTGKTTLLKQLNQKIENSVYLDKDVINQSLLQGRPYFSDYYNQYVRDQSYQLLLDLARLNLENGNKVVILDGYFGNKLDKEPFISFLQDSLYEVKILYCECPFEINKNRLIARGDVRDKDKLSTYETYYPKEIEAHHKTLDALPHLTLHTELDSDENLEKLIDYLKN